MQYKVKVCLFICSILLSSNLTAQQNIGLINGQLYNGSGFVTRDVYIVNGRFTFNKPEVVDTTIELTGKFIVPPFAEAHTHRLADNYQLDVQIARFINSGVFYVQNLQYIASRARQASKSLNTPTTVDVSHAYAAIVAKDGHTYTLYKNLYSHGILREFSSLEDLDGEAYFIIESESELEKKWGKLMELKPDIVKVFLEYSEEWDLRKENVKYKDQKGINPVLLPKIVRKAHENNLRVAAHIESSNDFDVAVKAGVDIIAHLPGFRWVEGKTEADYTINESSARLAKVKGTEVITTTAISLEFHSDNPSLLERIRKIQKRNLQLLKNHDVKILIGSDMYSGTSVDELMNLKTLGVYSNNELLKAISTITTQSIFPKRNIGEIREGFEGSLLVLSESPLENIDAIKDIKLAIKQGVFLK